jgi:hypothetical protein
MKQHKEIIILSAFRSGHNKTENKARHELLKNMLRDIHMDFKEVHGYYKNEPELSLIVPFKNEEEFNTVKLYAFVNFLQDSILVSNYKRDSYVMTRDGAQIELGKLVSVDRNKALSNEYYTYDPVNKTYWITE